MAKSKIFHAGQGKWEVRYKKGARMYGIGYFFPKKIAQQIVRKINKGKKN